MFASERNQGQRKPGGSEGSKRVGKVKSGGYKKSRAGFNAKIGVGKKFEKARAFERKRERERDSEVV